MNNQENLTESTARRIHYFDIDDTLMQTSQNPLRIHVTDPKGNRVESLSSAQFNSYKLPPGHKFDFSEFRSARKFSQSAKPIQKLMNHMKRLRASGENVEMLTARANLDKKNIFARTWRKHGVEIRPNKPRNIHVRRAGNLPLPPDKGKAKMISDAIKKNKYSEVHLYDDSLSNIHAMLNLKKVHPGVKFHGYHVQHGPSGTKITHYRA